MSIEHGGRGGGGGGGAVGGGGGGLLGGEPRGAAVGGGQPAPRRRPPHPPPRPQGPRLRAGRDPPLGGHRLSYAPPLPSTSHGARVVALLLFLIDPSIPSESKSDMICMMMDSTRRLCSMAGSRGLISDAFQLLLLSDSVIYSAQSLWTASWIFAYLARSR